ncbi:MAG: glycosyl hydrolase family 5 [Fibrobacter sp.]|nr:glycosyl hydrolase family 5 [Fibrobacter sp.]
MKFPYFKTLALVSIIAVAWNCSSDSVDAASATLNQGSGELDAPTVPNCWLIQGDVNYVIIPTNEAFIVTDIEGNNIGIFDLGTGSILDAEGAVIAGGIILDEYPVITPEKTIVYPDGKITDMTGNIIYDPAGQQIPGISSSSVVQDLPASSAIADLPKSSSSVQKDQPKSSSNQDQPKSSSSAKSSSSKDQPKSSSEQKQTSGSITATGSLNQTVAKGSSISSIVFSNVTQEPQRDWKAYFLQGKFDQNAKTYTVTGTVPGELGDGSKYTEKFTFTDGSFEVTITVGQASQPKSSSSVKSSSSQQQQQSSSSQGGSGGQSDPEASKYEGAGSGGQGGWATRYWDCCMPSCAWNENAGGNPTKTCDAKGKNFTQGGQSICSGGQQTTCTSQIPIIASDKVAYAFAAVPAADGGKCGKCFALTFTGEGKYETKANHQALKGKTLVVMASNIGGDVNHGQFDIMIPGGGLGAFNGCTQMGWGDQGEKYGGLLSNCENEVGYDGDLLTKRKECLTKKCNSVFANDTQAKEGCLFLATWMEAAGNPNHTFKEVECPQALKSKW